MVGKAGIVVGAGADPLRPPATSPGEAGRRVKRLRSSQLCWGICPKD